jgi:hypothetical protein
MADRVGLSVGPLTGWYFIRADIRDVDAISPVANAGALSVCCRRTRKGVRHELMDREHKLRRR